ncbi:MAG TPA: translocation/assembly module TamB domain-containing protein, partial [Sphingomicrobium sp.]|nr:translocation/assembly module TamB domain-containing protein [Sphingomicrobium sp.]
APLAWLYNSLHIDSLEADKVRLERLPRLKPSTKKGPMLPGFDIHIGKLDIRRLEIAKAVSGRAQAGRVIGSADIRAGRAMINLQGALDGGDRLAVVLDAEPDRDRFDLEARVRAPAGGFIPALFGSKRPVELVITDDGGWKRWRGKAGLNLSGIDAARLTLGSDSGKYHLSGQVRAAPFVRGRLQRLSAPVVRVNGNAQLEDRQLRGQLKLASPALRAVASGTLDLAGNAFRKTTIGIDLLRPPALFTNMRGRNVRMLVTLDGPFSTAAYAYRLTSPQVLFDNTGFVDVRAEGRGRLAPWPMRVPLRLQARAITGIGDVAGGILRNLSIEGMLAVTPQLVRGDNLALKSDKVTGKMALLIDLRTGRFDIALSGGLKRYLVPGIGLVDVLTDVHVVPGADGKARVVGKAQAWVRRFDNSFFAGLTGGLPRLTTDLERGGDGVLHLRNLQLYSPKLRLSGDGYRRRDGTFHIEARGRQAQYGPLRMVLDGPIERPRVELLLDRPNAALDIRAMRLSLVPNANGFDYSASGGSRLGPFTSNGRILLPRGGAATIDVAALNVAGTVARGALQAVTGGLNGRLDFAGGGIDGRLQFAPQGSDQGIEAHLTLGNATLPGSTPISVGAGRIDGHILLAEGRTTLDGTLTARGLKYGNISLARLTANAKLINGEGEVRAALAGRRVHAFDFVTSARVAADQVTLTGRGSIDRRPLVIDGPMTVTRDGADWVVAPTRIRFGGGVGTVSGRYGDQPALRADISAMPLQLLDVFWPKLGLAGVASGTVNYRFQGGRPNGRADLKVRGLSRAGLVLSSQPIDLGFAGLLDGSRAAFRAVAVSGGKTIGRAQGRFAPLGPGSTVAALLNAPMTMQVRYAGPADTLWRLSGVEVFDLSGPVAIGADIGGRLIDPQIRGSLRANGARIESAVTGTVVTGLGASGRFNGSRLALDRIAGATPDGGSLSGRGTIDFSGGAAAFDLAFETRNARILDRDDLAANVTGPLRVRSDGNGGTISGNLKL